MTSQKRIQILWTLFYYSLGTVTSAFALFSAMLIYGDYFVDLKTIESSFYYWAAFPIICGFAIFFHEYSNKRKN